MIKVFRSSAKVVAVVFAVLMLVFVLTSIDPSTFSGGRTTVGTVNGSPIDQQTFERAVQAAVQQQQAQSAGRLGLDEVEALRSEVFSQFVDARLLEQEYARRGITVTDDDVVNLMRVSPPTELLRVPDFQTDSQFDLRKYQRWLTSAAAQPYVESIAAQLRDQVLRAKLLRQIAGGVYVSDAALWERYRDETERVTVGLTAIVPRTAIPDAQVTVTDADARAYYDKHKTEFERPAAAFLSYVQLPRVPDASDSAAALARAQAVRAEIAGGAPFAEVAERESADSVSARKGGDLGEWTRGSFVPEFDRVAFSQPLNALSPPVLTQFGYHVIQVTGRSGDKATGRHVLIPIEVAGAHRERLDAQTDTLDRVAAEQKDPAALDTVARALGLQVERVGPVYQGFKVQIGNLVVPDAATWAFQSGKGELSQVIEGVNAFFVFRLDSLQPKGIPSFEQVKDAAMLGARDDKKLVQARELAKRYVAQVTAGGDMEATAKALGVSYQRFGPFARRGAPLNNPRVVGAAFGLKAGERTGVLETEDGLYVLELLARSPADSAAFTAALASARQRAIQEARQERAQAFLASLRDRAKVKDRRAEVEQQAKAQAELLAGQS